jgi:anhydro-N-acetylmuramic acid kinase
MTETELPPYLRGLISYLGKAVRTVVGLHSGTSTDGPTAMVARISGVDGTARLEEIVACETIPYPPELRSALLEVMERETGFVDRVCQADVLVARFFAEAARRIIAAAGLRDVAVDLIASSGQCTYQVIDGQRAEHKWVGDRAVTSMLDLGDGAVIAELTGVTTISNLRRRDNAVEGFGAPLVPLGDWVLFRDAREPRIVWNIGGIANATIVPRNAELGDVWAFDSGPGNMLIDGLVDALSGGEKAFDEDGAMAAQGHADRGYVSELLTHPHVTAPPPKAAARPLFGREFVRAMLAEGERRNLGPNDLVATATAFTAESIAFAYREFVAPLGPGRVLLSGGGARNPVLRDAVRVALPSDVRLDLTDAVGVPGECREVLAMIFIANQTVHGRAGNVPAATGASRPVLLGQIDPGTPQVR